MRFLKQTGMCLVLCIAMYGTAALADDTAARGEAATQLALTATVAPDASAALTETITSDTDDLLTPRAGVDRSLASWFEYYQSSVENDDYDKAIDAAAQMVEIAQDVRGENSELATQAMIRLARAQRGADELGESAASYNDAVAMVESREGIFSSQLIDLLIELGDTYARAGEEQLALDALLRARHVSHRQLGLFNTEQIPIADHLTEIYMATGEVSDANREQKFAFRISEHDCDGIEVCLVSGLYKMAQWDMRTGRNSQARELYRRALGALEEEYGEDDLRLVEALHGIANSYAKEGFRRKEGAESLRRAVDIFASQPYGDNVDHANALARLGDWHTLNSDYDEAKVAYEEAWRVMVEQGSSLEQANEFFAVPMKLRYSAPIPVAKDHAWNMARLRDAAVIVEFTVTEQGRVQDATVVQSDVSSRVRHDVRESVRRARYRPRMVDGKVAAIDGITIKQEFNYIKYVKPRELDMFDSRGSMACPRCDL